jgi:hypothetical protein
MARRIRYRKNEVEFEHPAKGADHCEMCKHFKMPAACEIVMGEVYPGDWCNKFDPKQAKPQTQQAANQMAGAARRGKK